MKCANCGAELAPEHRFCEVCGSLRPAFPQRIAESEREFQVLRNRHQAGQLSDAALADELKKLVVYDEDSGYWMLGARTGQWYWFDGQQWVPREPPVSDVEPGESGPSRPGVVQPAQSSAPAYALGASAPATPAQPSSLERSITEERVTTSQVVTPAAAAPPPASSAVLPFLQRMLFVAAAGTLGAFLGVLLAYIVGFFCRADSPARQLTCLFVQFAFFGAGLGLAVGLGCGLLLGGDARGAGLGIPLGALGGITGGILLMAVRLTLLPSGQGAEEASPGLVGQALPLLIYGLALALMIGLLPGFLVRSPSLAVSGVIRCCIGAGIVLVLVLVIEGLGLASVDPSLWTGFPLGLTGAPSRLAATAWPALLFGSILGAALGYAAAPS